MNKKLVSVLLSALLSCSFAGSSALLSFGAEQTEAAASTITISALNAAEEPTDIEVPYDAQRLAVMDLAALDILDNLGLGDRVVGVSSSTIDYLSAYETGDLVNLGNIKQADFEAVMACEPDLIFIGGRLAASYDELSKIAPVVLLTTDSELGVVASTEKNAKTIASIFGLEDQVDALMEDYSARIDTLKEKAEGQSAVIGMVTSGSFNVLGDGGRLSLITNEVGFENIAADYASSERGGGNGHGSGGQKSGGQTEGGQAGAGQTEAGKADAGQTEDGNAEGGQTEAGSAAASAEADASRSLAESSPHGSEASFELLPKLNPDYIFVLDRDSAIGTEGAQLAAEVMDNDIVNTADAAKNGHLVVLEHPGVWYTAEGGITALGVMIEDLEKALG